MFLKRFLISLFFLTTFSTIFIYLKPQKVSSDILESWFWMKKAYDKNKYELIVFGDSRVYRGINPDVIGNKINEGGKITCLNYGFSSAGFNEQIFTKLENIVNFNSPQKILILGITPNEFTPKASKNEHYFTLQTNTIDAYIRINTLPYLSVFDNYSLTELYNYTMDKKEGYYETFYSNGWVKSDKIPKDSLAALESYSKEFINNKSDTSVINQTLEFISKLNKKGVKVYGYYPPVAFALSKLEIKESNFNLLEFKEQFEKSGGEWIELDMKEFETYDGSHLNSSSALKLSEYLGSYIKNHLND